MSNSVLCLLWHRDRIIRVDDDNVYLANFHYNSVITKWYCRNSNFIDVANGNAKCYYIEFN